MASGGSKGRPFFYYMPVGFANDPFYSKKIARRF